MGGFSSHIFFYLLPDPGLLFSQTKYYSEIYLRTISTLLYPNLLDNTKLHFQESNMFHSSALTRVSTVPFLQQLNKILLLEGDLVGYRVITKTEGPPQRCFRDMYALHLPGFILVDRRHKSYRGEWDWTTLILKTL